MAERKTLASSAVSAARSVGSYEASHAPRLDAREVQQRVDQLEQPAARCGAPAPAAPGPRRAGRWPPASVSSSGPSISVSGVRNSWLTLEKNAVFARSISASASARCRSSSYARALAMAVRDLRRSTSSRKSRYRSSSLRRGLMPATRKPAGSSGLRRRDRRPRAPCAADPTRGLREPARSGRRSLDGHASSVAAPGVAQRPAGRRRRRPSSTVEGLTASPGARPRRRRRRARSPSGLEQVDQRERNVFGVRASVAAATDAASSAVFASLTGRRGRAARDPPLAHHLVR